MCILDDVCATMHAVSEGADMKFVEVMLIVIIMLFVCLMWIMFA